MPEPMRVDGVIAYLAVDGARTAIDWYVDVLGGRSLDAAIRWPGAPPAHGLALGSAVIYVVEAADQPGLVAPTPGRASVSLMLEVDDVGAWLARALAAGATKQSRVQDIGGHRYAWLTDPFRHRWCLRGPASSTPSPIRRGDLGYLMWSTPDVERAAAFYAAVLGWAVRPGSIPQGRRVASAPIDLGLFAAPRSTAYPCFAVGSADEAVATVRATGGTANDPQDAPHGRTAECVDDQGLGFVVYEPEPGGERPVFDQAGNVGWLTIEAPDADRAHEFYYQLLGWRDGAGAVPGHDIVAADEPVVVPTWLVDDIAAAAGRVRAAGGTAGDPADDGAIACVDDQGGRFRLAPTGREAGEVSAGRS